MSDNGQISKIEVGAVDDELRLWTAREAVRHGEMILSAQVKHLEAAESRATSFIGWMIIILAAIGAGVSPTMSVGHRAGALIAAVLGLVAVGTSVWALWPKAWRSAGYLPDKILDNKLCPVALNSELETLEALAQAYSDSIQENANHLENMARRMKASYILVGCALGGSLVAIFWGLFCG